MRPAVFVRTGYGNHHKKTEATGLDDSRAKQEKQPARLLSLALCYSPANVHTELARPAAVDQITAQRSSVQA